MRTIKFVFDTSAFALKLHPNMDSKKFYLEGYSDSDFAGDKETRASVYGFITFFCGAPVSWKSKSCKSVTLSSTEAEYFAGSETAKELVFIKNIIEGMKEENNLALPMMLRMDNTGAIYLANNQTTGQRTKHIDIRTHYVRNLILEGIIKSKFVKSEDNTADIFTKNTNELLFIEHTDKFMEDLEIIEEEAFIAQEDNDVNGID